MITYAPYVMGAEGGTLLFVAALSSTANILSGILFRLVPASVGAAAIWMSALMLAGGA